MRNLPFVMTAMLMASCHSVNIAWRGTVYATENVASTEGKVVHRPSGGFSSSVDAPKTTQDSLKASLPEETK